MEIHSYFMSGKQDDKAFEYYKMRINFNESLRSQKLFDLEVNNEKKALKDNSSLGLYNINSSYAEENSRKLIELRRNMYIQNAVTLGVPKDIIAEIFGLNIPDTGKKDEKTYGMV